MARWRAYARLTRPGNLVLGVVGVVAGGVGAFGPDAALVALGLAAVGAAVGMAGGNALNDAADAPIDATAHPDRPIPRGDVTIDEAFWFGGGAVVAGIALALAANPLAGAFAAWLAGGLVLYESAFKRRGLVGNVLIALVVGGLFLVGAVASAGGPWLWDAAALARRFAVGSWDVVLSMALLAFLATVARELYKDIQDMESDGSVRRSLPMTWGTTATRILAGGLLLTGAVYAVGLVFTSARFGDVYLLLVIPTLLFFLMASLAADAKSASRAVKIGMAFALAAFVSVGL